VHWSAREIPDAVRDDKVEAAVSDQEPLHGREEQPKAVVDSLFLDAARGGEEHRPRQVSADDVPPEVRERDRVAPGTAADIEPATAAGPLQLLLGECHQHGIGGDCAKLATMLEALSAILREGPRSNTGRTTIVNDVCQRSRT
jgi:hypothetical protein